MCTGRAWLSMETGELVWEIQTWAKQICQTMDAVGGIRDKCGCSSETIQLWCRHTSGDLCPPSAANRRSLLIAVGMLQFFFGSGCNHGGGGLCAHYHDGLGTGFPCMLMSTK